MAESKRNEKAAQQQQARAKEVEVTKFWELVLVREGTLKGDFEI